MSYPQSCFRKGKCGRMIAIKVAKLVQGRQPTERYPIFVTAAHMYDAEIDYTASFNMDPTTTNKAIVFSDGSWLMWGLEPDGTLYIWVTGQLQGGEYDWEANTI